MKAKLFTFVRGLKNGTPPRFQSYFKALTLFLGLVLSMNAWGAEKTLIIDGSKLTSTATTSATDYTYGDFTITMSDGAKSQSSSGDNKFADNAILIGKSGKYIYNKTPFGKKITKFELYANKGASTKVSVGVLFSTTAISAYATGTNTYTATLSTVDKVYDCSSKIPEGAKYFWYQVTNANNSQVMFRITYEEEEEDPTKPSLSVDPEEIDFGEVDAGTESVEGKEVTVTMANIEEVLVGFSTNSPFSVDKESLTASGKVVVTPTAATLANVGEYSDELIVTDAGELEKTVTVSIKVKEPAAPTGTFNKFTGDELKEGDYVICVGTDAMKNSVTSNRLDYASVTVSSDKITNPEASVIWHIAPAAEGNWSIFNTAYDSNKGGYAAGTGTKNQAGILAATTDVSTETKAQWTCAKVTNGYNFENVANSAAGVNSKLQKNGTYGFACYGSFSDISLYKKHVDLAKSAVTFATCTNGSVGAQVKGAAITSGAIVDEDEVVTLTNTPATGYKLDAYKVYKTGDESITVSVKDGKFTMPAYPVTVSATFSLSIETPELSEAAGDKDDAFSVKVTNYNGDYSYYYTLDGIDPTNASTPYVDADGIAINASCTLKVIAYKGDVTSPVASAAYNLPLMTMDAIFAAATAAGSTPTNALIKFTDCVVTGVKGSQVFLTDNAGKGLIIYASSHGFAVNDKLNGAVNVKVQLYNGNAELTELTSSTSGLTVTKDGSVTPITNIGIADLTGVNTGAVLSYTNLTSNGTDFSDGTNTLTPYNTFITLPSFENGDKYNVTGVYIQYNAKKEIAPRTLADLQKIEATKYAINLATVEHGTIATYPETEAADGVKVTLSATPATGYMLSAWSVVDAESNPVEVTANQFTMPAMAVTVSATFVELPIWATTYTSNVTLSGNKVKLAEAYQPADYPEDGYDAKKDGSTGAKASISVKVPANTTGLHYHLFAWKGEGGKTVSIKKGEAVLATFTNIADDGVSGASTTYELINNPVDAYGYVALEGITEETTITFSTPANSNRICLFGVNAIQPAAITIDPASKDFGEVKQGFDAEQVFALTPNAFATGTITAEIDGDDVFSASTIADNKVTVTFAPTEIKDDYSATLIIKHDGTQMCTATLTGKGITATTPEIAVSTDEIDFGKVKQDATIADQTVTVTLNYLDAATASIDGTYFSIDKTDLVAGANTITISATAATSGEKSATITITGTGATTKTIAVKMDVTSKWAGEYTSNVEVKSDKVIIAEEEYEAVKAGTGKVAGSTKITVPEGAYALHFHAAGWNNEDVTLSVKNGDTELGSFDLYKDAGVTGNSPFTLQGENYDTDQYFHVEFDALEEETDLTFAATSGNRFVLYGVNQEGGVLPVLDHITIGGEATKLNYNTTDAFDPVGLTVSAVYTLKGVEQAPVDVTDKVDWTFDPATFNTVGEGLSVTATASFTDGETKTADKVITGISVEEAIPSISASRVNIEFGEVTQGATVEDIQSKITLKYIDEVSVTLSETTAFEIDKTSMTETGYLTISAVTTAAVGEYTATVTIKDLASEANKVLNLSITIKEAPHPTIYSLVTDASTLKAGDVIVMAATYSGNTYVNGALSGDLLTCVDATVTNGKLTAIGACEFMLGGEAGAWALTSTAGKLGATAAKKLTYGNTKDNFVGTWTISIDGDNNATIAPEAEGYGRFMYNHNNGGNRFLTYTSNTSASMLLPQIYRLGVDGETNASTLPSHADVTVNEGGNLLIDAPKTLGDIYVMEGGKVTISGSATLTVSNFVIKSSMGGGQSGQVLGVTSTNLTITGSAYFDVTLGDNGNPDKWHAFAVPFNVDAINGIYDLDDNKLTNEVNYAIMVYQGAVRAEGKYGWIKIQKTGNTILAPGTFYLMTVDGERTTYRMKMNGGFSVQENSISVTNYTGAGAGTDAGWNGIANNQLGYNSIGVNVQVLNPTSYTYETKTESSTNFTVGTPFFYQADAIGKIDLTAPNASENYAPRRVGAAEIKNVDVTLSNATYTDHLYVSASEEATNEYQIGRDLVKMTMTSTPSVPQIFAEAYGNKLCMVDAPMVNNEATYALSLYAPKDDEYTLAVGETDATVYLMEDNAIIWNLSRDAYTFTLPKGNTSNYSLVLTKSQVSTRLNEIFNNHQEQTEKIIYRNHLYILHQGKMIDAIGQQVK